MLSLFTVPWTSACEVWEAFFSYTIHSGLWHWFISNLTSPRMDRNFIFTFIIFEAVNPWTQLWKIHVFLLGKYIIMGNHHEIKSTYLCVIMEITQGKKPRKDESFSQGKFAWITLRTAFYIAEKSQWLCPVYLLVPSKLWPLFTSGIAFKWL